jgi:hypothetical protein
MWLQTAVFENVVGAGWPNAGLVASLNLLVLLVLTCLQARYWVNQASPLTKALKVRNLHCIVQVPTRSSTMKD